MQRFKTILFVSQGLADESAALNQALSIARNNGASLTAMIVCPELPKAIQAYEAQYEESLRSKFAEALAESRQAVKVGEEEIPVPVTVERGKAPSVRIIQQVLRQDHDLVIKQAEPKDGGYGFKALDTDLLRKCPCPVWLSRPIMRHRDEMQVAVAIDPEKTAPEGHDLSVSLLKLAPTLGYEVEEARLDIHEILEDIASGKITEVFGCGTAAVVSPVGLIAMQDKEYDINGGQTGPVAQQLFDELMGIQYGEREDPFGWVVPVT